MANRRSRIQAQKNNRPAVVTGQPHLRSTDTNAFLDGIGRLGSTHKSTSDYRRKPKHVNRGWGE